MRHRIAVAACFLCTASLWAQESQIQAEFRGEATRFGENCVHPASGFSFGSVIGCGQTLFTDHPLHIAAGSLAPGNGFGTGLAFVTHYTPNEDWRLFFDFDAVGATNGSWRAGGYMTAVLIRHPKIVVHTGTSPAARSSLAVEEMPAFHVYAQTISLNKLSYFGLGQDTTAAAHSYFGMQQTIAGGNVVWPIFNPLKLSLFGEVNGRFIDIRSSNGQPSPSIEHLYTEASAPGLSHQPGFGQFREGVRLNPSFANGYVRLNYSAGFEEWVAGGTGYSFRRFTADLSHQFPLYSRTRSLAPNSFNGPDSCLQDVNAKNCPPVTRNLEGSFGLRFLYTASYTSAGNTVPFYLDPTLGGSDIDGSILLPSYSDYRFRGPNLMLLRGSFEHSIYKWPVGIKFMVDEGRVALNRGDLGFDHLSHSFAAGFTVHAGGLPLIDLLFAWGGKEGTHNIATVNSSLLGGSPRPSLY